MPMFDLVSLTVLVILAFVSLIAVLCRTSYNMGQADAYMKMLERQKKTEKTIDNSETD